MEITTKQFSQVVHKAVRQGKNLTLKTGKLAPHCDGAVEILMGETHLLVTAVMNRYPDPDKDFMPLGVEYRESRYAAGKIGGGRFNKREGRPSDEAILYARLVDRPMRPMFPKGMINDVVITISPLSLDQEHSPGELSIIGASAATMLAGIPFTGPVSGVRIGYIDGHYVIGMTESQAKESLLDLHVAGTADNINMMEAGGNQTPIELIHDALPLAQQALMELAKIQQDFLAQCSIVAKDATINLPSDEVKKIVETQLPSDIFDQLSRADKGPFDLLYAQTEHALLDYFKTNVDAEQIPRTANQVKMAWFGVLKKRIRTRVAKEGKRIDDRTMDQIRNIYCEIDTVPRSHGTGLFRRGDTQVLSLITLGSPGDAQLMDGMEHDDEEMRFMHHYKMPPFSNNEAMMIRGTNRRETGHGRLAQKAIEPILPSEESFPYVIRVVSEVLGSGGSTSMASVCGSTLGLMAAGVPIAAPVSGIAMGLITTDDDQIVLTDIMGTEDFIGDMDFKLAGTATGMTAIQMDIKLHGISVQKLQEILQKANTGRQTILEFMLQTIEKPKSELSKYAPLLLQFQVKPEQVREVIGPGGSVIQEIIRQTGVKIDLEDDGRGVVTAKDQEAGNRALQMIQEVVRSPGVGDMITGKITRVEAYGVFVDLGKRKTGLCHVSQLGDGKGFVPNPQTTFKVGQTLTVKVVGIEGDKLQLKKVE